MAKKTLLVLATPSAPELKVLEKLSPSEWELLAIDDSLKNFRSRLTQEQLESVEVLLLCRLIGLPVGGDKARLQELIPALPNLKWCHSSFAGVNHLLYPALVESSITVTNARGVFSSSLAEWALFAMNWFAKDIVRMQEKCKRHEWDSAFTVEELRGRTLGVIGYGDIGRTTAKLARAYGMRIVALRRRTQLSAADDLLDKVYPSESLLELIADSDYIVMATPLTEETRGMLSAAAIAAMRPNAVFVNLGRGPCVDEAALTQALQERRIRGAALDVFTVEPLPADSPLWELENALLSPHCADRTAQFQFDTLERFLSEAARYAAGEPLENVVDKRAGY